VSVEALRGPEGLRRWTNDDILPCPGDVFQERLYCIRWMKTVTEINDAGQEATKTVRRYAAPEAIDLAREARALELLRERFANWQREGFIPSRAIISGYNTDQPIRERGWTHWHHLFTPRQLRFPRPGKDLTVLGEKVCALNQVTLEELRSGSRRAAVVKARREMSQAGVKFWGFSGADIARYLGVTNSCVTRVVSVGGKLSELKERYGSRKGSNPSTLCMNVP
jgi:hypothetical protein